VKIYGVKFHPDIKDKIFTSKEKRDEFIDNDEEYQKYARDSRLPSFSCYSTEIE
jgi:hypothetical protein